MCISPIYFNFNNNLYNFKDKNKKRNSTIEKTTEKTIQNPDIWVFQAISIYKSSLASQKN